MGMIMKDGIPYGGIYPIDDAPTQGSNNAVKSGGVFSSLSNKVDKVAGKGLSTNDYDDTEKGKVADNTSAIEAIVNEYGAKNVLPFDLNTLKALNIIGTWNGNIYTVNGVTFTVDDVNKIITVNGTATHFIFFVVATVSKLNQLLKPNMNLIGTGCPQYDSCGIYFGDSGTDYGDGVTFTTPITGNNIGIGINTGATVSNLTFKPMIRDARIKDSTYAPYSMTNRELTDRVVDLTSKVDSGYKGYVDIMSDGVKSYGQLLSELFTTEVRYLVINHRLTARIVIGDTLVAPYVGRNTGDNKVFFGNAQWDPGTGASIGGVVLDNAIPSNCKWTFTDSDGTLRDLSDLVPGSGVHIRIYY